MLALRSRLPVTGAKHRPRRAMACDDRCHPIGGGAVVGEHAAAQWYTRTTSSTIATAVAVSPSTGSAKRAGTGTRACQPERNKARDCRQCDEHITPRGSSGPHPDNPQRR